MDKYLVYIHSPPHHRPNVEAETEGGGPGVDVAFAVTTPSLCMSTIEH